MKNRTVNIVSEAKRLSILKWKAIVNKDDQPREIKFLRYGCGFCEMYQSEDSCNECPLDIMPKETDGITSNKDYTWVGCIKPGHPFQGWIEVTEKEAAIKVLELIESVKVEDYE